MSATTTELEVSKPEVYIAFIMEDGFTVDAEDAADAGGIGDGILPFLGVGDGLLAELAEGIEVGLVLDIGEVVLLQRVLTLQAVLELTPFLDDF